MMKNKSGRPSKKDTIDLWQLERLSSLGLTDKQLGFVYDVTEQTINAWKKKKEISLALKKGKDVADKIVERSLFERAIGYSHPEDKILQYEGEPIIVPTIKHYPPDTIAAIFWLKNRKPEEWREKHEMVGEVTFNLFLKNVIHKAQEIDNDEPRREETTFSRFSQS